MTSIARHAGLLLALSLLASAATAHTGCGSVVDRRGLEVGPKAPACANVLLLTLNRASLR